MRCNKKPHNSPEEVQETIDYLLTKKYIENQNYQIYECSECYNWHFGTNLNFDIAYKPKK